MMIILRTFEIPSSARIAGSNNGIYSKNHDLMEVGLSTNSGEYDGTNAISISEKNIQLFFYLMVKY